MKEKPFQNKCCIYCSEELEKDVEFEVVGDAPDKAPAPSAPEEGKNIANGNKDSAQPSTSSKGKNNMDCLQNISL